MENPKIISMMMFVEGPPHFLLHPMINDSENCVFVSSEKPLTFPFAEIFLKIVSILRHRQCSFEVSPCLHFLPFTSLRISWVVNLVEKRISKLFSGGKGKKRKTVKSMQIKRGIFHRLLSLRLLHDTQMMAVNNIFLLYLDSVSDGMTKNLKMENLKRREKNLQNPSCLRKIVFASNAKLLLTRLKKPFVESTPRLPSLDTTASCDVGEISSFLVKMLSTTNFNFLFIVSHLDVMRWCRTSTRVYSSQQCELDIKSC